MKCWKHVRKQEKYLFISFLFDHCGVGTMDFLVYEAPQIDELQIGFECNRICEELFVFWNRVEHIRKLKKDKVIARFGSLCVLTAILIMEDYSRFAAYEEYILRKLASVEWIVL